MGSLATDEGLGIGITKLVFVVVLALIVVVIFFKFVWPLLKIALLIIGAITVAKWVFEALRGD